MRILVKYPTRQRPAQFLQTLREYYTRAKDNSKIEYLISYDKDDSKMNQNIIDQANSIGLNIKCVSGYSKSKIHACNRDLEKAEDWDIVVLVSDDMFVQVDGWDEIIRNKMKEFYSDTDGCLWFWDGHQERICTFTIMGRKYFERFGYLYHPSYASLWCDNEFTEVAQGLGKIKYFKERIVEHVHPCWGKKMQVDDLYRLNESFYKADHEVYVKRKQKNFA
jgi:hypothetical protein